MRFAHLADIHLGHEQYHQSWRADDYARAFREAVEKAVTENVDFAIIAGDIFNRSVPNPKAIKDAIDTLSIFKENNIPVFAVEGNHDKTIREVSIYDLLESLGLLHVLGLRKKRVESDYVKSESLEGVYLVKGIFDGVEIVGDMYRTSWQLKKILPYLKAESDECILILHQSVKEVVDVGVDTSYELTLSELPSASYYAMGHIHAANVYEFDGKYLVYPGSIERYDAKEASLSITYTDRLYEKEGPKKGFYVVEDFVPRFVEVESRNIVTAYIEASSGDEAEDKILEVLSRIDAEDIFLANITSKAHIDAARLNEIASNRARYARVNYKPFRTSFEEIKVKEESEFFTDFELQLLEYLRGGLEESELQAVVQVVREHFGLIEREGAEEKGDVEAERSEGEKASLLDFTGGEE